MSGKPSELCSGPISGHCSIGQPLFQALSQNVCQIVHNRTDGKNFEQLATKVCFHSKYKWMSGCLSPTAGSYMLHMLHALLTEMSCLSLETACISSS